MRTNSIIVIPLVFAAGVAAVVLLQLTGIVRVVSPFQSANAITESSASVTLQEGGASVGKTIASSEDTAPAVTTASIDATLVTEEIARQVDELRKQVQDATVQRDVLRGEIKQLSEQVDDATINNAFLPSGDSVASVAGEALAQSGANTARDSNRANRRGRFGQPDGEEQYASLISAGIDPTVAAQIKQRSDQWSLRRLDLIDQATREGWRRSEQFEDRMSELRDERPDVRSELGDDDYDRYLYASGESNRVQIASIIDGSAAQLAGMEIGDLVRSYANQRVYTSRELQRATREGSRGESVSMFIERGSQQLSLEIPRGPLGVSLVGLLLEPEGL